MWRGTCACGTSVPVESAPCVYSHEMAAPAGMTPDTRLMRVGEMGEESGERRTDEKKESGAGAGDTAGKCD